MISPIPSAHSEIMRLTPNKRWPNAKPCFRFSEVLSQITIAVEVQNDPIKMQQCFVVAKDIGVRIVFETVKNTSDQIRQSII